MKPRDTHDLGRLYWHTDTRNRSWKPTQISRSQMLDGPLRRGLGVLVSLPGLRHGIVFGWWGRKNKFIHPEIDPAYDNTPEMFLGTRVVGERTEEVRDWL